MNWRLNIDIFEGPLDLLLFLIKEQKMDIYDVPILDITKQYMEYLDIMQDLNLDVAGEYLLMASELARIKSKMLLPRQEVEGETEEEGEDPRVELTRRLLEYKRFKEAAFELRKKEFDKQQVFARHGPTLPDLSEEVDISNVSPFDLLNAFQKIIKKKNLKKDYEIEVTTLSVSDRITYVLEILSSAESVTFESLFTPVNTRQEVIVLFLAILELMRLGLIRVQQTDAFQTIRVYRSTDKETEAEILAQYHQEDSGEGGLPANIKDL